MHTHPHKYSNKNNECTHSQASLLIIYSVPHLGGGEEKTETGANPDWPSGAPGDSLRVWPVDWPAVSGER